MQNSKATPHFKNKLAQASLAFRIVGAAHAVLLVENGRSLPDALSATFSKTGADASARGAIQDIAYHVIRNLGCIRFLVRSLTPKTPEPPLLKNVLVCALGLLLPNSQPFYTHYTTVDQAVHAAAAMPMLAKAKNLVNAVLRRFLREQAYLLKAAEKEQEAKWNYPSWWCNRLQKIYPDKWEAILLSGNTKPPLTLRVNQREITTKAYAALAASNGMQAHITGPAAVTLSTPVPVSQIPGFMAGMVSVQDAAAQLAAPLLDLKNGMHVLDACAAPGGKSGHMRVLADIDLLALDSDGTRLQMVRDNLKRLHLKAKTKEGDAAKQDWWDGTLYDRILADVPCTASGIIRRHPDIRWLRRENDIVELSALAKRILDNLWSMLKPGGKFLLATCSLWPEESEQQAIAFSARMGATRLLAPGQILPLCETGANCDGLFYALFKKT